ncbi:unnamed protein product [Amoebophrya sp. A120]|nr:unnamed protein product [Amoebophrya sp. A120]|eukprot:GSA120T00012943001.1
MSGRSMQDSGRHRVDDDPGVPQVGISVAGRRASTERPKRTSVTSSLLPARTSVGLLHVGGTGAGPTAPQSASSSATSSSSTAWNFPVGKYVVQHMEPATIASGPVQSRDSRPPPQIKIVKQQIRLETPQLTVAGALPVSMRTPSSASSASSARPPTSADKPPDNVGQKNAGAQQQNSRLTGGAPPPAAKHIATSPLRSRDIMNERMRSPMRSPISLRSPVLGGGARAGATRSGTTTGINQKMQQSKSQQMLYLGANARRTSAGPAANQFSFPSSASSSSSASSVTTNNDAIASIARVARHSDSSDTLPQRPANIGAKKIDSRPTTTNHAQQATAGTSNTTNFVRSERFIATQTASASSSSFNPKQTFNNLKRPSVFLFAEEASGAKGNSAGDQVPGQQDTAANKKAKVDGTAPVPALDLRGLHGNRPPDPNVMQMNVAETSAPPSAKTGPAPVAATTSSMLGNFFSSTTPAAAASTSVQFVTTSSYGGAAAASSAQPAEAGEHVNPGAWAAGLSLFGAVRRNTQEHHYHHHGPDLLDLHTYTDQLRNKFKQVELRVHPGIRQNQTGQSAGVGAAVGSYGYGTSNMPFAGYHPGGPPPGNNTASAGSSAGAFNNNKRRNEESEEEEIALSSSVFGRDFHIGATAQNQGQPDRADSAYSYSKSPSKQKFGLTKSSAASIATRQRTHSPDVAAGTTGPRSAMKNFTQYGGSSSSTSMAGPAPSYGPLIQAPPSQKLMHFSPAFRGGPPAPTLSAAKDGPFVGPGKFGWPATDPTLGMGVIRKKNTHHGIDSHAITGKSDSAGGGAANEDDNRSLSARNRARKRRMKADYVKHEKKISEHSITQILSFTTSFTREMVEAIVALSSLEDEREIASLMLELDTFAHVENVDLLKDVNGAQMEDLVASLEIYSSVRARETWKPQFDCLRLPDGRKIAWPDQSALEFENPGEEEWLKQQLYGTKRQRATAKLKRLLRIWVFRSRLGNYVSGMKDWPTALQQQIIADRRERAARVIQRKLRVRNMHRLMRKVVAGEIKLRKLVKEQREVDIFHHETAMAIKVQRRFRGRKMRAKLMQALWGALDIEEELHKQRAKEDKEERDALEKQASTLIQKWWKTRHMRWLFKKVVDGAVDFNRLIKRRIAEEERLARLEQRRVAACRIQKMWHSWTRIVKWRWLIDAMHLEARRQKAERIRKAHEAKCRRACNKIGFSYKAIKFRRAIEKMMLELRKKRAARKFIRAVRAARFRREVYVFLDIMKRQRMARRLVRSYRAAKWREALKGILVKVRIQMAEERARLEEAKVRKVQAMWNTAKLRKKLLQAMYGEFDLREKVYEQRRLEAVQKVQRSWRCRVFVRHIKAACRPWWTKKKIPLKDVVNNYILKQACIKVQRRYRHNKFREMMRKIVSGAVDLSKILEKQRIEDEKRELAEKQLKYATMLQRQFRSQKMRKLLRQAIWGVVDLQQLVEHQYETEAQRERAKLQDKMARKIQFSFRASRTRYIIRIAIRKEVNIKELVRHQRRVDAVRLLEHRWKVGKIRKALVAAVIDGRALVKRVRAERRKEAKAEADARAAILMAKEKEEKVAAVNKLQLAVRKMRSRERLRQVFESAGDWLKQLKQEAEEEERKKMTIAAVKVQRAIRRRRTRTLLRSVVSGAVDLSKLLEQQRLDDIANEKRAEELRHEYAGKLQNKFRAQKLRGYVSMAIHGEIDIKKLVAKQHWKETAKKIQNWFRARRTIRILQQLVNKEINAKELVRHQFEADAAVKLQKSWKANKIRRALRRLSKKGANLAKRVRAERRKEAKAEAEKKAAELKAAMDAAREEGANKLQKSWRKIQMRTKLKEVFTKGGTYLKELQILQMEEERKERIRLEHTSAVKLQKAHRNSQTRKIVSGAVFMSWLVAANIAHDERVARDKLENKAAKSIQKSWRARKLKKTIRSSVFGKKKFAHTVMTQKAVDAQRAWRQKQDDMARKLQRQWKARQVRFAVKKSASGAIPMKFRVGNQKAKEEKAEQIARERAKRKLEREKATKLQKWYRRTRLRLNMRELVLRALEKQRQEEAFAIKFAAETKAVLFVQKWWRGRKLRETLRQFFLGATDWMLTVRRLKAKEEALEQQNAEREAGITIVRCIRKLKLRNALISIVQGAVEWLPKLEAAQAEEERIERERIEREAREEAERIAEEEAREKRRKEQETRDKILNESKENVKLLSLAIANAFRKSTEKIVIEENEARIQRERKEAEIEVERQARLAKKEADRRAAAIAIQKNARGKMSRQEALAIAQKRQDEEEARIALHKEAEAVFTAKDLFEAAVEEQIELVAEKQLIESRIALQKHRDMASDRIMMAYHAQRKLEALREQEERQKRAKDRHTRRSKEFAREKSVYHEEDDLPRPLPVAEDVFTRGPSKESALSITERRESAFSGDARLDRAVKTTTAEDELIKAAIERKRKLRSKVDAAMQDVTLEPLRRKIKLLLQSAHRGQPVTDADVTNVLGDVVKKKLDAAVERSNDDVRQIEKAFLGVRDGNDLDTIEESLDDLEGAFERLMTIQDQDPRDVNANFFLPEDLAPEVRLTLPIVPGTPVPGARYRDTTKPARASSKNAIQMRLAHEVLNEKAGYKKPENKTGDLIGVRETKSAAAAELMQKLVSKLEVPLKVDFARYKKKDIADGVTQASELLRLNIYALRRLEHEQSLKNDKGT